MRTFYESSLWILQHFLPAYPDLHHGLLGLAGKGSGLRESALQKLIERLRISTHSFGAFRAQGDQVLFFVSARLAPWFQMVYLQMLHATADLASPAVTFQYPTMQLAVCIRVEPESRVLGWNLLHEAFRATSERKASCCGLGRDW
jgi:hypothetical protein